MTRQRAFSLVEVTLVVVLMGMMAGLAAPRYSQFIANQQIEAAARRVTADLTLAQREARQSSSSRTVTFDVTSSSYLLTGIKDMNRVGRDYQVFLNQEPYRVKITSASFGGSTQVVFNGYGAPNNSGSVVISIGNLTQTITVDTVIGRSGFHGTGTVILSED
ncbi:MAG: prepilin-type N-terminal cleavage/methylation domain-containing protein [Planctomycetes bacterium]|nr:prepilin-type N-terminal cleavage/methylation domain-containing protein [Planctomycetota bacterium]MBI3832762.1 prepilin-type N-terminal cleavage/methylation domain-containing protein [Planctomycetota bacterium]